MARESWYADNRRRAFPYLVGAVGSKTAEVGTIEASPYTAVVDVGFLMGLASQYVAGEHKVWLQQISRSGTTVTFTFTSDAPGLYQRPLIFTRDISDADYAVEYAETDIGAYGAPSESAPFCSTVIQMGDSGSFTAACTGQLRLLFNDDNLGDNQGGYYVTINEQTYFVDPKLSIGADGPMVTEGEEYAYTATGTVIWRGGGGHTSDATGPLDPTLIQTAGQGTTVPGAIKWSLVGVIVGHSMPSESITCPDEPIWSGYMVSGDMTTLAAVLGDGDTWTPQTVGVGGIVEPALVQSLANSYISSINLANTDRTRVNDPPGCSETIDVDYSMAPGEMYVAARCLRGDVRFSAGYNATVSQSANNNQIILGAQVGAGAGQPCASVPLFTGETPPPGSSLLEGGPNCNEVIRSINGVGGQFSSLLSGVGVQLTTSPETNSIIVNVNMAQLAFCYSEGTYSDVSESLPL